MNPLKASLFTLFFVFAHAQDLPNPGPLNAAEPQFLFEQAQLAIKQNHVADAIRDLERLRERYPQADVAKSALLMLPELYLKQNDVLAAVRVSHQYLLGDSTSESAQEVRLKLISAYFILGQHLQARATAKELLALSKAKLTQAKALYLLAKIDLKEGKFKEARAKLDALPAPLPAQDRDSLLLSIGVSECDSELAPAKSIPGDDPWIAYFELWGRCLKAQAANKDLRLDSESKSLWCKSFATLTQKLNTSKINSFQKKRLKEDLQSTQDLAKPMECKK